MKFLLTTIIALGFIFPLITSHADTKIETTEQSIETSIFCSCVKYVRERGVNLPKLGSQGTPNQLTPNSPPVQGGAVIFSYGHIAFVEAIMPNGMWVSEANKKPCQKTERFVRYDDPSIRGFYH